MLNPFTGIRFLVIEETDISTTVVEEYDTAAGEIEPMRKYLEQHIHELNQNDEGKRYKLQEETQDDGDLSGASFQ